MTTDVGSSLLNLAVANMHTGELGQERDGSIVSTIFEDVL